MLILHWRVKTIYGCICVLYEDPPTAPNEVMKIENHNHFTRSTASITLSWSAGSGADNYTIMVTPPLPESAVTPLRIINESVQITVHYNEQYYVNITAQNCAGRNSTVVPLLVGK